MKSIAKAKAKAKATIDDVAKLAGVSIKTVSRVVNREPNVRESTQQKVNRAIRQLNYTPNQSARNLASYRSRFIGLIYDDPSAFENPSSGYITRLQQGSLRACRAENYELLIHPCNHRHKDVGSELTALIEQVRPSGMVIAAPLSNMPKIVGAIKATGTPFVRLSAGQPSDQAANKSHATNTVEHFAVSTNDREISAEMTRYLASQGHRKIAFIKGHDTHKAVAQRFLGYQDGLRESNLRFLDQLVKPGDNSFASGKECAQQLLQLNNRPTAIFAANDDMAAGVLRTAMEMSIKVPRELSIAGCDDISLARQLYPTLTTIRQPLAAMAERAVTLLIGNQGCVDTLSSTEIIPAQLRLRESTGPVPD